MMDELWLLDKLLPRNSLTSPPSWEGRTKLGREKKKGMRKFVGRDKYKNMLVISAVDKTDMNFRKLTFFAYNHLSECKVGKKT